MQTLGLVVILSHFKLSIKKLCEDNEEGLETAASQTLMLEQQQQHISESDPLTAQSEHFDRQIHLRCTLRTIQTKYLLCIYKCDQHPERDSWQSVVFTMSEVHSRRKFMALLTSSLQSWRATIHSSWFFPVTSISCEEEQTTFQLSINTCKDLTFADCGDLQLSEATR